MANIRTIDYEGQKAAIGGYGPTGWMLWSGSVSECTSSGGANTTYEGIGFEFIGSATSFMRFSHVAGSASDVDIRANRFFVGQTGVGGQFISGSAGNIEISSSNFHLTAAGDVIMQGTITATAGSIGGFTIASTSLTATNFSIDTSDKRITLGDTTTANLAILDADEGIFLGHGTFANAPFSVTTAGELKAVSGQIAAFDISNDTLSTTGYGANAAGVALQAGSSPSIIARKDQNNFIRQYYDSVTDWGLQGYSNNSALFQLGATNQIAGWKFDNSKIISNLGSNSATSPGIIINSNGTIETDPFISGLTANATGWQLRSDGRAEFENAVIRGTLSTAVFEKDTISVVGGQVMVANAAKVDTTNPRYIDYPIVMDNKGNRWDYSGEEMPAANGITKFNGSGVYRDSDWVSNISYLGDLWWRMTTPAAGNPQTFRLGNTATTDPNKLYRLTFYADKGAHSQGLQFALTRMNRTSGGVYNGTSVSRNGETFQSSNTRFTCLDGLNTFHWYGDSAVETHRILWKTQTSGNTADISAYIRDVHVAEVSQSLTVDNAGGFADGEILVAKSTDQGPDGREGFVREYMRVVSSSLGSTETPASGTLDLSSYSNSVGKVFHVTASDNYTFTSVNTSTADVPANNDYHFFMGSSKSDTLNNLKNKIMDEVLDSFAMVTGSTEGAADSIHMLSHGVGADGNSFGIRQGSNSVTLSGAVDRVKPTLVVERNLDALVSGNERGYFIQRMKDGQTLASQGKPGTGYILLNAQPTDDNSPYIDIVERNTNSLGNQQHTPDSQHSVFGDVETQVRIGDLQGITDNTFTDGVAGYGIYTKNGYFKGKVEVTNPGGASMEHNFGGPSGSAIQPTLLVEAGEVTGSQWLQRTTTRHIVKNGGLAVSSSVDNTWHGEIRSKQTFNRSDDHTFQSDFTIIDKSGGNIQSMGLGDVTNSPIGTEATSYQASAHSIYFSNDEVHVIEGQSTLNNTFYQSLVDAGRYRIIIKPHPNTKGASYKLYKHPELVVPVATYDSVAHANAKQDALLDVGFWTFDSNPDKIFFENVQVLAPGAMTTTIEGDKITTGKIQSTNLSTNAGSVFDLDDGTFKLGGTDAAHTKLEWDGTSLTLKGQIQIEAGSTFDGNTIASLATLSISSNTNIFSFDDNTDTTPSPTFASLTVNQTNQADNLVSTDIAVTNGTLSNFSHTQVTAAGTGTATFDVTPNGTYPVTVAVSNDGLSDSIILAKVEGGSGGSTGPQGPPGDNGDDAINTAVVSAYKYFAPGATIDQPITARDWNFANGAFTNTDLGNSWAPTIPSVVAGQNLFICTAIASADAATDSVAAADWTTAQLFSAAPIPGEPAFTKQYRYDDFDTNGEATAASRYTFQQSYLDSAVYDNNTFVNDDFSTAAAIQFHKTDADGTDNSTYYNSLVVGDSFVYYVSVDRWYQFTISTIDSTPPSNRFNFGLTFVGENIQVAESTISNSAGTDVNFRFQRAVDGTNGTNGVSTAVVYGYKRATSTPSDKPDGTNGTWTFSTGTFDGNDLGNSYTAAVPSGTDDLYVCTAVASSVGSTDSVAAGDWTSAQLLASNGITAKTITVTGDASVFIKDSSGNLDASAEIVLTANGQNLTQAGAWSQTAGTLTSDSTTTSGGTATVTSANFVDGMTVSYTTHANDGSLVDSFTIRELEAGSNALTALLSNESHVIPAGTNGAVDVGAYGGSGTTISVFEGAVKLDYDASGTTAGHWTVATSQAPSSTITINGISDSGDDAVVADYSSMSTSVDAVSITFTITGKTLNGTAFTMTKTQSISKSKTGATGTSSQDDLPFLTPAIATLATPVTGGLLLASDIMGFHGDIDIGGSAGTNASLSDFSTYMDSVGNFYLGGTSGALTWNNTTAALAITGDITVTNPGDFADPLAALSGSQLYENFQSTLDTTKWTNHGGTTQTLVTTTVDGQAYLGSKFYNDTSTEWTCGLMAETIFLRSQSSTLTFDVCVNASNPQTMMGFVPASTDATDMTTANNFGHAEHLVYFQAKDIRVYESGTQAGSNVLGNDIWSADVDKFFRVKITLKPAGGARYEVYANGDFTTPVSSYDTTTKTTQKLKPVIITAEDVGVNSGKNFLIFNQMGANADIQPTRISGNSIATGKIQSTLWTDGGTDGSEINLDTGEIKLGGDTNPPFHWNGVDTLDITGNITVSNTSDFAPTNANFSDPAAGLSGSALYENFQTTLDTTKFTTPSNGQFAQTVVTQTDDSVPYQGSKFLITGTSQTWTGGLLSEAVFLRSQSTQLDFEVVVNHASPATFIGFAPDTTSDSDLTSASNYPHIEETLYIHGNTVSVRTNGTNLSNTDSNAMSAAAWVSGTDTKLRCRITLKPGGGARYEVWKDGPAETATPFFTYTTVAGTGTDTERMKVMVALYYGAADGDRYVIFGQMGVNRGIGQTTISGDGVTTGKIKSTNLSTTVGSELDLDAGTIKLGGTADPGFQVDSSGLVAATNFAEKFVVVAAADTTKYFKNNSNNDGVVLIFDGSEGGDVCMHMQLNIAPALTNGTTAKITDIKLPSQAAGTAVECTVVMNVHGGKFDDGEISGDFAALADTVVAP